MRHRLLLLALSILSPLAALACSGDDTPAAKPSGDDAGAGATDATSNINTGARERVVDAGAATDAAQELEDAGTFCAAAKAIADRCGEDVGCKAADLARCDEILPLYTDAFKQAYVACAPTLACDASIDDPCIAAKVSSVAAGVNEAKFEADLSKACGADAGRFVLGPYFSEEIFAKADTTCPPKVKSDAGADECVASGFFCALKVFLDETPPDACRDQ